MAFPVSLPAISTVLDALSQVSEACFFKALSDDELQAASAQSQPNNSNKLNSFAFHKNLPFTAMDNE